jgi:glycosyltransferase involved in cell wall biosynthesis
VGGDVDTVTEVAIVHDYLTQRGGAERVVLALAAAYPAAPIHTSLYEPADTFPEFARADVRPSPLDRVGPFRRRHRLALPVLAPVFSAMRVEADVTLCSSSGWAHGARTSGRKVVYCYTPARWLYQAGPYLAGLPRSAAQALAVLGPALRVWDRRAAASADRYLVISSVVRQRVADAYGIDAEVLAPPVTFGPDGPSRTPDTAPGFFLCVSRLLSYKNVAAVVEAFASLPDERLVLVGGGPLAAELSTLAPANVTLVGEVDDALLRGLYAASDGLVAAVLRWGGFLDTTVPGQTGVFFDEPTPSAIAGAVRGVRLQEWDPAVLKAHAERYSTARFTDRLRAVMAEEAAAG